jgi:hypothetical protein
VFLLGVFLATAPSLGLATTFSYLMLPCCLYGGGCLLIYRGQHLRPDSLRFEALVESNHYLAGALAFLYEILFV